MRCIKLVCIVSIFFLFSLNAWATGAYDLTQGDLAFIREVKEKVGSGDRNWVAGKVRYPVYVFVNGKERHISNARQLLSVYDEAFNTTVLNAIASQDPDEVFKNWQGIMIGDGQIWISIACRRSDCTGPMDYGIGAINNCFDDAGDLCKGVKGHRMEIRP